MEVAPSPARVGPRTAWCIDDACHEVREVGQPVPAKVDEQVCNDSNSEGEPASLAAPHGRAALLADCVKEAFVSRPSVRVRLSRRRSAEAAAASSRSSRAETPAQKFVGSLVEDGLAALGAAALELPADALAMSSGEEEEGRPVVCGPAMAGIGGVIGMAWRVVRPEFRGRRLPQRRKARESPCSRRAVVSAPPGGGAGAADSSDEEAAVAEGGNGAQRPVTDAAAPAPAAPRRPSKRRPSKRRPSKTARAPSDVRAPLWEGRRTST